MPVAIELDLQSIRRATSLLTGADLEAVADNIGSLLLASAADRIEALVLGAFEGAING